MDENDTGDELVIAEDDDLGGLDGKPIPKDDRVIPPTMEKVQYNDQGVALHDERVQPFVYARAHHNLPGFEQPVVHGEEGARPRGLRIGEEGWIPNNEEGVRAVELGFAELIDTPPDAGPQPKIATP